MTDEEYFQRVNAIYTKEDEYMNSLIPKYPQSGGSRKEDAPWADQSMKDTYVAYHRAWLEQDLDESVESIDAKVASFRAHWEWSHIYEYNMSMLINRERTIINFHISKLLLVLEYQSTRPGVAYQEAYERTKRKLEAFTRAGFQILMVDYQPLNP